MPRDSIGGDICLGTLFFLFFGGGGGGYQKTFDTESSQKKINLRLPQNLLASTMYAIGKI